LGFAAIAVVVHFYPALSWLFWAGAAVAALSLVVTLSIHAFANRRLNLGKRRLDEYERIAREAEEHAVIRGKSKWIAATPRTDAPLMYFGVLAVGVIGAILARLHPHGMARALFAMALAQTAVAAIALIAGLGLPWSPPAEILLLNGFFIALFAGSGWLFRRAAQGN
jgi:hypothetical protein